MSSSAYLETLPTELKLDILSRLALPDVCSLSLVNRSNNTLCVSSIFKVCVPLGRCLKFRITDITLTDRRAQLPSRAARFSQPCATQALCSYPKFGRMYTAPEVDGGLFHVRGGGRRRRHCRAERAARPLLKPATPFSPALGLPRRIPHPFLLSSRVPPGSFLEQRRSCGLPADVRLSLSLLFIRIYMLMLLL